MSKIYIVPTPIGNLQDITLRALDVFKDKKYFFAEDTRRILKLFGLLNIPASSKKFYSFFDKNRPVVAVRLREMRRILEQGDDVVITSDAGTPSVSDPALAAVKTFISEYEFEPLPGASALCTAASMLPWKYETLIFLGFIPRKEKELRAKILEIQSVPETVIIYFDSPKRYTKTLAYLEKMLDAKTEVLVFRELTKMHQDIRHLTLASPGIANLTQKGEITIAVKPVFKQKTQDYAEDITLLRELGMSSRDIAAFVSRKYKLEKNKIYMQVIKNEE